MQCLVGCYIMLVWWNTYSCQLVWCVLPTPFLCGVLSTLCLVCQPCVFLVCCQPSPAVCVVCCHPYVCVVCCQCLYGVLPTLCLCGVDAHCLYERCAHVFCLCRVLPTPCLCGVAAHSLSCSVLCLLMLVRWRITCQRDPLP
jgi:hypothetical protein